MQFKDKVIEEWSLDCKIQKTNLSEANYATSLLHAKYLRYLYKDAKPNLRKAQLTEKKGVGEIRAWYRGARNSKEALATLKRPAQQEVATTQAAIAAALDADPEVHELRSNTAQWEDCVALLESILGELARRNFLVSNSIKITQMESGQ